MTRDQVFLMWLGLATFGSTIPTAAPQGDLSESIVAYFTLAGGEAVDAISGEACETPSETPIGAPGRPGIDPIPTPNNEPEPATSWNDAADAATYFDGGAWFQCPASITSTVSGSANRTICVWAQINETNEGGLFQYGDRTTCEHFGLRTTSDASMRIQSYGKCNVDAPFDPTWLGEWSYYCVTFDGVSSSLYVNWVLVTTEETPLDTGASSSGETEFFIGYNDLLSAPFEASFFIGAMADLAVVNKSLTVDEMLDLSGFAAAVTPAPTMNGTMNGTMAPTDDNTTMIPNITMAPTVM
mmetsp:Transcript_17344/g.54179  ORF Transcript_17344/g.54179 Transcript_17344/m.54179 type:complete len:298 (+) Transcript_17344:79-972(+)